RGKGNCYSFASGFTHLARAIGYDAVPVAGQVPSARGGLTAHGWTEITINGVTYVFDPELAMANGYDLFKKTYSQTPFTYYK
ncbi:MAG: transglutaminase domain-containing protein, partial [Clostridiales bacterium]|nr:transglutaminase domain-containing protein [Clostridiales bacterium]